jgi:hypothetical protein
MTRDHFAQAYRQTSNHPVSETERQMEKRVEDTIGTICGMLYSIVTLKAFFPKSPAPTITDNPVKDAASGDQKDTQTPLV